MAFQKLYADLVDAEGSVYVLYLATFDFLGRPLRFAELETYLRGEGRRVYTGTTASGDQTTLASEQPLEVKLATSVGEFMFRARPVSGSFVPREAPRSGLEWHVCMGRTEARLELPQSLGGGVVIGTGYSDHLTVSQPAVRKGLRALDWGRAHLSGSSIVWTRLKFSDGQVWEKCARWALPGGSAQPGPFTPAENLAVAQIAAAGGTIESERVLHVGSALDRSRVPSTPVRWLLRAVAGATHQRRWVVRIAEPNCSTAGWGIHESVTFARPR